MSYEVRYKFFSKATTGSQLTFAINNIPNGSVNLTIITRGDSPTLIPGSTWDQLIEGSRQVFHDPNFYPAGAYVKVCFNQPITIAANTFVIIITRPGLDVNPNSITLNKSCTSSYMGLWIALFVIFIVLLIVALILVMQKPAKAGRF
jgi:hypothetical protein